MFSERTLMIKETLLNFLPALEHPELISVPSYRTIKSLSSGFDVNAFRVAEIDPAFLGGVELCDKYHVDPKNGANCLIVSGRRGENETIAACLVPVGSRYDMSGVVRKTLNARMVSVAPLDMVISTTKMEYGSITPIGLPESWQLFIDPMVLSQEQIIVGSGLQKSKLSIPSKALLKLPNALVLEGLAKI